MIEVSPVAYLLRWIVYVTLAVGAIAFSDVVWRWLIKWTHEAKQRANRED